MSNEEILVKAQDTRDYAQTIKKLTSENPYDHNKLADYISSNRGDARNELFNLNSKASICANVTRQLMERTAIFLENAADIFEQTDTSISKEIISR